MLGITAIYEGGITGLNTSAKGNFVKAINSVVDSIGDITRL